MKRNFKLGIPVPILQNLEEFTNIDNLFIRDILCKALDKIQATEDKINLDGLNISNLIVEDSSNLMAYFLFALTPEYVEKLDYISALIRILTPSKVAEILVINELKQLRYGVEFKE